MRLMILRAALMAAADVHTSAPGHEPTDHLADPHAEPRAEGEGMPAAGQPAADIGTSAPQHGEANVAGQASNSSSSSSQGENTAQGQRILALESRVAALEAALAAKGHESLTSSPPMPRPGDIVMVREPHHPDYPAIVAEVVDDLGAIHANVFRGTHVPHAVNHLPNIEPGAEDPGWYWPPRS